MGLREVSWNPFVHLCLYDCVVPNPDRVLMSKQHKYNPPPPPKSQQSDHTRKHEDLLQSELR